MAFILSFDAGTTSVRAIVFDDQGAIRAVAQKEIRQFYPQPGWVEHDPHEIWSSQMAVAIEAIGRARIKPQEVAAVGITNQRETVVVWDRKTGEAIHNAIVWQDRRTAATCDRLRTEGHEPRVQELTGLRLDPYFSATKLAWILDTVPDARRRAEAGELCFGTIDTWLVWKLTSGGLHLTDPGNASRTLLYDLHGAGWNEELLRLFEIPAQVLPQIRRSSEVYGTIRTSLGLTGIPVAGIAGDQQAALFGQLCVRPGLAKNTYGTGCFLLQNVGTKPVASRNRLLTSVAWQLEQEREFALEGSVFVGGAALQWLRDGLQLVESVRELDELAASVPDSNGVFFVPAFTGLGAPQWDPYARGLLIGLTRDTSRAHIARAALDGIAFQVADLVEAMAADTGRNFEELRVDGGGANSAPLLQIQADLLQVPVVRPAVVETTALGAAYFAGLAVGTWKDVSSLQTQAPIDRVFSPRASNDQAQSARARWRRAVERSRAWVESEGDR